MGGADVSLHLWAEGRLVLQRRLDDVSTFVIPIAYNQGVAVVGAQHSLHIGLGRVEQWDRFNR